MLRTIALFLALLPAAVFAEEAAIDGWVVRAVSPKAEDGPVIEERHYGCRADGCAGGTLQCVGFRTPAPPGVEAVDDLADADRVPLGQMAFWVARMIATERADLFAGQPGSRLRGPDYSMREPDFSVREVAGKRYYATRFDMAAGDVTVGATLAFWPEPGRIVGLRCSFRAGGEDPAVRIEGLVGRLVAAP